MGIPWFKHVTASLTDPDIRDLVRRFKADGYMVFFRTIELVAQESRSFRDPVELSMSYVRDLLQLRSDRIKLILRYIEKQGRFKLKFKGDKVSIFIPKLNELLDNWSKRKESKQAKAVLGSGSVVALKKHALDLDLDLDKDKDMYIRSLPDIHIFFSDYVEHKLGTKPLIKDTDNSLIIGLLKLYPVDLIKEAIKVFVDEDPEAVKIGYSFNAFYSRINANVFEAQARIKRAIKKPTVVQIGRIGGKSEN